MDITGLWAAFARSLSTLYGRELPTHTTLAEVAHEVNAAVERRLGAQAERLGSLARVTAQRHGAIRAGHGAIRAGHGAIRAGHGVIRAGTPAELQQVATIFAAMGIDPTGFYDLRDAQPGPSLGGSSPSTWPPGCARSWPGASRLRGGGRRMTAPAITMIDEIQGPPAVGGPFEDRLQRPLHGPYAFYQAQRDASLAAVGSSS